MRDAMGSGSRSFLTRSIGNALASSIPLLCIVVCDPIHKSVSDLAGKTSERDRSERFTRVVAFLFELLVALSSVGVLAIDAKIRSAQCKDGEVSYEGR
jgi:hypothetical protein